MAVKNNTKEFSPPQIIIFGFAVIIFIGTLLLNLPVASADGKSIGLLNALFTATSAVCVTGLSVVDTGADFSLFGQVLIMLLIQFGGLGFMTFGVVVAVALGKRIGIKERLLIKQAVNANSLAGLVKLTIAIAVIALLLEFIGTIVLTLNWYKEMGLPQALYYALFHSISAFNNAGFSLWPDSLSRYVGDPVVNITAALLFVLGGLGFTVILDIYHKRSWRRLSLNSKTVLVFYSAFAVIGIAFIFFAESFNPATLGGLSLHDRIWAAFFQGLSPRTAGFNTVDIAAMTAGSQLLIMLLMFVGAASGSTGGGIKVNTFAVLVLALASIVKGRSDVNIFERRIGIEMIFRSLAVIVISMGVVFTAALLLTFTEHSTKAELTNILFETVSAFGTVGLSAGLTSDLTPAGRIIIIATMFIGRLGPLTLAFALSNRNEKKHYRYVEEKLLIG